MLSSSSMKKNWMKITALLVAIAAVVVIRYFFGKTATTVHVQTGAVEGVVNGNVISFKGIPYAAPPVGALRWREPQDAPAWQGTLRASMFGHDCMQKPITSESSPRGASPSEDCLYLNVWRPLASKFGKQLPVLVWIHGGGYVNGGSSSEIYDGSQFARQGLVFVSLNYRLGRFGFFAHPALSAAKEGKLANYGYMDQIAALSWIRKNIEAFGGDPRHITVMGESAGGTSVIDLMTSQADKNLFDRAIILSGGGRGPLIREHYLKKKNGKIPSAEETGLAFAKTQGISGTNAKSLAALRALPARKIVSNLNMLEMMMDFNKGHPTYPEGPIIDGDIVKRKSGDIFKDGQAAKIPVIIGTTDKDVGLLIAKSKNDLFSRFGINAVKAQQIYDPTGKRPFREVASDVARDFTMTEPARFVAQSIAAGGNKSWLYRFHYVAQSQRKNVDGAHHATELAFVFDNLKQKFGRDATDKDEDVAKAMNSYFANFARTGDPNGSRNPVWDSFNMKPEQLLAFTLNKGPVMQEDPWTQQLDLIQSTVDKKNVLLGQQ